MFDWGRAATFLAAVLGFAVACWLFYARGGFAPDKIRPEGMAAGLVVLIAVIAVLLKM